MIEILNLKEKPCTLCGDRKKDNFWKNKRMIDGLMSRCKPCCNKDKSDLHVQKQAYWMKVGYDVFMGVDSASLIKKYGSPPPLSRYIPLTSGEVAIVDNEDYDYLSGIKWSRTGPIDSPYVYASCHSNGNAGLMHRFIMKPSKGDVIDHINHNTLDNRKCNLRVGTQSQNLMNMGMRSDNTSGVTGVSFEKWSSKWRASIQVDKKSIKLGRFTSMEQAIEAREKAEKIYFGDHAYNNGQ